MALTRKHSGGQCPCSAGKLFGGRSHVSKRRKTHRKSKKSRNVK